MKRVDWIVVAIMMIACAVGAWFGGYAAGRHDVWERAQDFVVKAEASAKEEADRRIARWGQVPKPDDQPTRYEEQMGSAAHRHMMDGTTELWVGAAPGWGTMACLGTPEIVSVQAYPVENNEFTIHLTDHHIFIVKDKGSDSVMTVKVRCKEPQP